MKQTRGTSSGDELSDILAVRLINGVRFPLNHERNGPFLGKART